MYNLYANDEYWRVYCILRPGEARDKLDAELQKCLSELPDEQLTQLLRIVTYKAALLSGEIERRTPNRNIR